MSQKTLFLAHAIFYSKKDMFCYGMAIFTISGEVMIRTDGKDEHHVLPGQEFIVNTEQTHYAVVGDSGWDYVAAFDPVEEEKYASSIVHE